ncbi:MAG: hypothetical protein H6R10_687 [Rhodocyclaceae bacterium]|nr:hypothetical protein [Rhodocyclaceae bacterium]
MTIQITRSDYFMGRDTKYARDLTAAIAVAADVTIDRVNQLLLLMAQDGVPLDVSPATGSLVASGWRPPAVNGATPGAAPRSKHMTGHACDLYDPEGDLDEWCSSHLEELERIGLWLEHPSATKGWCHLQALSPRSGRRVFYP